MQVKTIPGTVLPCNPQMGADTFSVVSSLCNAAGGLSLSQIAGITGLEASTIQNWVKRGWVSRPTGKKYSEQQVARILLISVLRDSLPLEKIASLLQYVNGSVDDCADDIIDEGELYNRLCAIIFGLNEQQLSHDGIQAEIARHLSDYKGPKLDSRECLKNALEVMATAYLAARLKQRANSLLSVLLEASKSPDFEE